MPNSPVKCSFWHIPPKYNSKINFKNFITFTVVRDPVDRIISEYNWRMKENSPGINKFIDKSLTKPLNFSNDCHLIPQSEYLTDYYGNKIENILRFTHLESDLKKFCGKYNLSVNIPHNKINKSTPKATIKDISSFNLNQIKKYYDSDYEILHRVNSDNKIIINFFTSNLCEEWKNHLFTLRKHNISQKLVVFPLDNNAKKCVQKERIKIDTSLLNKINVGDASFNTNDFKKIMYYKILTILKYLEKGYNVFYLDTDTIVFGNILQDVQSFPSDYDIYAQADGNSICAGCMYIISNKNTITMFKNIRDIMDKNYKIYQITATKD